jgi:hypothetical protein
VTLTHGFPALGLVRRKAKTLSQGRWAQCERKILVMMTVDAAISDIVVGVTTDTPEEGGFDEVWLADYTEVDAFSSVDLFAVAHRTLRGSFATGNRGQKPYGLVAWGNARARRLRASFFA